jgi:dTDP-4-dehydrorhamnose reductase
MRSLILGASGLLGSHLLSALQERDLPHLGSYYQNAQRDLQPLDLRDSHSAIEMIQDYEPEVVYLTATLSAGMTQPTTKLLDCLQNLGSMIVVFSPDEVFGNGTWNEDSAVQPVTERGKRHAKLETLVRDRLPDSHLILRTSCVFGAMPTASDFTVNVRDGLQADEATKYNSRRHCQPTYAPDLADVTLDLVHVGHRGTVHITGPDRHTEFTLARLVAHVHDYDTDLVSPSFTDDNLRPLNIRLERKQMRELVGAGAIRPTADGLRAIRDGKRELIRRAA